MPTSGDDEAERLYTLSLKLWQEQKSPADIAIPLLIGKEIDADNTGGQRGRQLD